MKRSELEKYLGKRVTITLFDDDVITGELHKTNEERFKNNANLSLRPNYYFMIDEHGVISDLIFRVSHIKKLELR